MLRRKTGLPLVVATLLSLPIMAQADTCSAPAWDAGNQYVGGELVTYDSAHFKAKWWIKDSPPDRSQQWGPWEFIEDCIAGGDPEPDPDPVPVVSPATRSFNLANGADAVFNLNTDGDTLMSVENTTLSASLDGNEFSLNGFDLVLSADYLSTLAPGSYRFQLNFASAAPLTVSINVVDVNSDAQTLPVTDAVLSGGAGLNGGQIDLQHGSAVWNFYASMSGEYVVEFDYQSPHGEKENTFFVGSSSQQVLSQVTSTTETVTMTVNLSAGEQQLGVDGGGNNWGYIFLEQVRVTPSEVVPEDPAISPASRNLVLGSGESVSYSLNRGSYSFDSVTLGGTSLQQGTDYSVSASSLTLNSGFVGSLSLGVHSFNAHFADSQLGNKSVGFELRLDSAPVEMPQITPDSQTVNVDAPTALSFAVDAGSFTFSGLQADGLVLESGSDYSWDNGSLTLNESYIGTLISGQTVNLSALFDSADHGEASASFLVTAMQALTGDCFDATDVTLEGGAEIDGDRAKLNGEIGSAAYWTFSLDKAGQYQVVLTYSTEGGSKYVSYRLDEGGIAGMLWPDTPPETPAEKTFVHSLSAGVHSAGITNRNGDWGWASVHNLCVNFLGSLDILSPQPFDDLSSGSDIVVDFDKGGAGALTYSVNGGSTQTYNGESPLTIPSSGDGLYDLEFGVAGTNLKKSLRVQVGEAQGPFYVDTLGTQFALGNRPFYFNGSNQYYLMYKPEAMTEDFFKRAHHLGMTSVRTWMFCNDSKTHDGVCINMKTGDGFLLTKAERTAEEQAIVDRSFELFDNYVALAHQYDIKLVLSLADHWNYFGSLETYGSNHYSNPESIANFKAFITELLQHHNPLTGYTYAEDPAIMMWEVANEPRCASGCDAEIFRNWADEMSRHIKSLAPNHLVSLGTESSFGHNGTGDDFDFVTTVNDLPTIDAVSAHMYPTAWNMSDDEVLANIDLLAEVGRALNKPTYLGEFSWPVASEASVAEDLQTRYDRFVDWFAKAEEHQDVIGGLHAWQLSGLEWGNGGTPLDGCQWCAGPYGEPTGAWTANNDGYQMYCAITPEEQTLTETGAPGSNKEGNTIHIDLHKPVCDLLMERSDFYRALNQQ
ncbi:X2-like carbohydrate binding domain-containing protein [Microbulbifer harenosus]|nr:X2-like carbohydrate binding domain-containing protein [Microbulbifer harenosus]